MAEALCEVCGCPLEQHAGFAWCEVPDIVALDHHETLWTGREMVDEIAALRAEVSRLREALGQYADRANWASRRPDGVPANDIWIPDANGWAVALVAMNYPRRGNNAKPNEDTEG